MTKWSGKGGAYVSCLVCMRVQKPFFQRDEIKNENKPSPLEKGETSSVGLTEMGRLSNYAIRKKAYNQLFQRNNALGSLI